MDLKPKTKAQREALKESESRKVASEKRTSGRARRLAELKEKKKRWKHIFDRGGPPAKRPLESVELRYVTSDRDAAGRLTGDNHEDFEPARGESSNAGAGSSFPPVLGHPDRDPDPTA